jgi:hypothetical protein
MSLGIRFGQQNHIIPVYAPQDVGTADVNTTHVNVSNAHRVTFAVQFGNITNDSKVITVEESSAATTVSAEAIPFKYRFSGIVGTDTWGAVTTVDSGGTLATDGTHDNSLLLIDVDPSILTDGDNYLSVRISSAGGECYAGVVAYLAPRYSQLDHLSTT